eukprot:m.9437 g.9437  ORF g.9437 m.9437 type:complete len:107 (+) comp4177_c0_seq1:1867-2187(+)
MIPTPGSTLKVAGHVSARAAATPSTAVATESHMRNNNFKCSGHMNKEEKKHELCTAAPMHPCTDYTDYTAQRFCESHTVPAHCSCSSDAFLLELCFKQSKASGSIS